MTKIHALRRFLLPCIGAARTSPSPPHAAVNKRLSTSLRDDPDDNKKPTSAADPHKPQEAQESASSCSSPATPAATAPFAPPRSSRTMVIGTIFGHRRGGHVWFCVQHMRSKKKAAVGGGGVAASQTLQNTLPLQSQLCFEGETLTRFLKSVHREIESARAVDETLPLKFWFKQQFAVGVNEVTRGLERMPRVETNVDDSEAQYGYFQAILLASDCNPRSLTKHLPALSASRNVPLISVKDRKEGSLRLGELLKVKTAIAIGVKARGSSICQVIEEALTNNKINSIEDEAMEA